MENQQMSAWAILARQLAPHLADVKRCIGFTPRRKTVSANGLLIDAFLFPETIRGKETLTLLEEVINRVGLMIPIAAKHQDREIELFLPATSAVNIIGLDGIEDLEKRKRTDDAFRAYKSALHVLSAICGMAVEFHMNEDSLNSSPGADEERLLFVAGASPPGEQETHWIREAYKIQIEPNGKWVLGHKPTRGRGIVLTDSENQPVMQILGRTVYLLIPVLGYFHGLASESIFSHLIVTLGNAMRQEKRGTNFSSKESAKIADIVAAVDASAAYLQTAWEKGIKATDQKIDDLRRDLATQMMQRNKLREMILALNQGMRADMAKRTPRDIRRLRRHPHIQRIYTCDGGLHVDTQPIHAISEGVTYNLGTFTIRIGEAGHVSLWARETTHPKGIPHPHLPRNSTPCFGTATEAIIQASAHGRLGDTVELVLRWLQEGYTPKLADAPISEWPRVQEIAENASKEVA